MKCIPPVFITEAMLQSASAIEPGPGEVAWSSGTSYAVGQQAILGSPSSTVTVSNGNPAVVTWTANGMAEGTPVVFTNSGGALPAGITAGLTYYLLQNLTVNTFTFATAVNGTAVATTSAGSGTQTCTAQVHQLYESLTGGSNKPPMLNPNDWSLVGPTNKWAMFDLLRNTATKDSSGTITVSVKPGQRVDSIALLGLVANSYRVVMTSVYGGGTVYDSGTVSLNTRDVSDWYDYFFAPFSTRGAVARFDLPPYSDAVISVTITASSGAVQCGACVIGLQQDLGLIQYNALSDAQNFSSVDRDNFGNATMVQRRSIPKTSQVTNVPRGDVNRIRRLRDALNAVVAVYAGIDDSTDDWFEAFVVLGFYRKWQINAAFVEHAQLSFDIEEV